MPRKPRLPKDMTVKEWADCWLDLYPGVRNKETAATLESKVGQFVRSYGPRELRAIDRLVAQKWAVKHRSQVRHLRQMFNAAMKAGLVEENVWRTVELPKGPPPRMPPTPQQFEAMVALARARGGWWEQFAECMIFTAHTGLRGLEVEGVATQDFLEAGTRLVVRGKRRAGEREFRLRTVYVPTVAREAFERRRPRRRGRVWRAPKGGPLTLKERSTAFSSLADELGFDVTFHGLRHYCASWMLNEGATKLDVAIQLGHFDDYGRVDTTQLEHVYGHVDVTPALGRLAVVLNDQGGSDDGFEDVERAGEDFAAALRRARARERGSFRPRAVQAGREGGPGVGRRAAAG